ncbi:hypothetical protein D3C85_1724320 [compost metagenome]
MGQFALYLVGRKAVLVSEQMLGAFSMLLREVRLRYPHGSKELAEYIVRRFNEERPLTERIVAVEKSNEVIIMPTEACKSGDNVS